MNDIVTQTDAPVPAPSASGGLLAQVVAAASNPDVDADKMQKLADLAMQLQDREMKAEFNRSLNSAIAEVPRISKQGRIVIPGQNGNPDRIQGRFAHFEDIDRAVRPILDRHGLMIRFEVGADANQRITVRPILSHRNGYEDRGAELSLPLDTSGSKNNTQGVGSSVSYGKRYAMCAALNIVTEGEDTDGNLTLETDMLNDREQRLVKVAEAQESPEAFEAWFRGLPVSDRAFLTRRGIVAEKTGGTPLPGREHIPAAQSAPRGDEQPSGTPDPKAAATGWADACVKDLEAAESLDALMQIQTRTKKGLDRLKAEHPELAERVDRAGRDAYERLNA